MQSLLQWKEVNISYFMFWPYRAIIRPYYKNRYKHFQYVWDPKLFTQMV